MNIGKIIVNLEDDAKESRIKDENQENQCS